MYAIAGFLVSGFASLLDPINLVVYFLAGTLIRSQWISIACGTLWQMGVQFYIAKHMNLSSTHDAIAPMIAALCATFIVHVIARKIRSNGHKQPAIDRQMPGGNLQKIPFKSSDAALDYACKYLDTSPYSDLTLAVVEKINVNNDDEIVEFFITAAVDGETRNLFAYAPKTVNLCKGDLIGCKLINRPGNEPFVLLKYQLNPIFDVASEGWEMARELGS